jgi:hypothetical protein
LICSDHLGRFSWWYRSGFEVLGKHLIRGIPTPFTEHKTCEANIPHPCLKGLGNQYYEAIAEWGYLFNSFTNLSGIFPGQIDKCLWGTLGKTSFLNKSKSRVKSYRLEGLESKRPDGAPRYFDTIVARDGEIRVMLMKLK